MQAWRQIAHDAKDILTVCLAKAIDRALSDRLGREWFADFAQDDAKEKVSNRITKNGQTSVRDLDLQALLKFLRFRSVLANQVLGYYGLFDGMDSFAADAQIQQFNGLLDRLINDFRNRIEAHSRAADIEKELSGQGLNRIYGYEEAVQDMYKLAQIFADVKDSNGVAYYKRIAALTDRKKKRFAVIAAAVLATVALIAGVVLLSGDRNDANAYYNNSAPVVTAGEVTVQPMRIYYKGNALVAECHVINGTEQSVKNIDVYHYVITNGGQRLAAANFGYLEDVVIAPGQSAKWKFYFPKETVMVQNAQLPGLVAQVKCRYE